MCSNDFLGSVITKHVKSKNVPDADSDKNTDEDFVSEIFDKSDELSPALFGAIFEPLFVDFLKLAI